MGLSLLPIREQRRPLKHPQTLTAPSDVEAHPSLPSPVSLALLGNRLT